MPLPQDTFASPLSIKVGFVFKRRILLYPLTMQEISYADRMFTVFGKNKKAGLEVFIQLLRFSSRNKLSRLRCFFYLLFCSRKITYLLESLNPGLFTEEAPEEDRKISKLKALSGGWRVMEHIWQESNIPPDELKDLTLAQFRVVVNDASELTNFKRTNTLEEREKLENEFIEV